MQYEPLSIRRLMNFLQNHLIYFIKITCFEIKQTLGRISIFLAY